MNRTYSIVWRIWSWTLAAGVTLGVMLGFEPASARGAAISLGNPEEERFLAGLRERRLFALAETRCRQLLAAPSLTPWDRGWLTVELLRVAAGKALQAPPADRATEWRRADQLAQDFVTAFPQDPWRHLVQLQQALAELARGEAERAEADIAGDGSASVSAARDSLRRARRLLELLERELPVEVAAARRGSSGAARGNAPPFAVEEWESLSAQVRFQRGRADRLQGETYPAASPDRLATISAAVTRLEGLGRELPLTDPLSLAVRLELAGCRRLLQDWEAARSLADELDQEGSPVNTRLAARAERIRIALGAGQRTAAATAWQQGRTIAGEHWAELDLAGLEWMLAEWQAVAGNADESARWQQQALEMVRFLEQSQGTYWGRRGEILLVRAGRKEGAGGAELLRRTADDLYRQGQLAEALATYERAYVAARDGGQSAVAFEAGYKAALVEHERGQHQAAGTLFRRVARELAQHPQAPQAHLLALGHAAELWKQPSADRAMRDQYLAWLEEHRTLWPSAPSVAMTRWWLGGLYEKERDWPRAAQAYREVPWDAEEFVESLRGAERCWDQAWPEAATDQQASAAASELESALRQARQPRPESWTPGDREAVRMVARLKLLRAESDGRAVATLLREALSGMPPAAEPWRTQATALLAVALVRQPDTAAEAQSLVAALSTTPWEPLLDLLRVLQDSRQRWPATREATVAVEEAVLARLAPGTATLLPEQRVKWDRLRANTLLASGNRPAALVILAELSARWPRDRRLQVEYAMALIESDRRDDRLLGLQRWRVLATHSEPRSAEWFQAKYQVARAQHLTGDSPGAIRLIEYLAATEDLAASGWESQFTALLRECRARNAR